MSSKRVKINKRPGGTSRASSSRTRHANLFGAPTSGTPRAKKRLAERRRNKRLVVGLVVFVGVAILVGGFAWVTHHPRFHIQAIDIKGEEKLSRDTLIEFVDAQLASGTFDIFSPRNIAFYPKGDIQEALKTTFPRIADVEVRRSSFANPAIAVELIERRPVALWCTENEECFLLDYAGFVFAKADGSEPSGLRTYTGGAFPDKPVGTYFAPAHFRELEAFIDELVLIGVTTRVVDFQNEHDFDVIDLSGVRFRMSFDQLQDPINMLSSIKIVLDSGGLRNAPAPVEYIDMRFGNRVYYKFVGDDEEEAEMDDMTEDTEEGAEDAAELPN